MVTIIFYHMAVSQGLGTTKFPNFIGWNRYKIDVDSGVDFPIYTGIYTPNANMADHSVVARDKSNESEASWALMF